MKKLLTLATLFFLTNIAGAELPNIVALVNETPITLNEFRARKHMIMELNNIETASGAEDTQLSQLALKSLIDESLIFQFAKDKKIPEEEISGAISSIEQRNKMQSGDLIKFLRSKSVDIESFKSQIRGELVKMNIISSFSRGINVSTKEIDAVILASNQKDAEISAKIFTSKNKDSKTLNQMYTLQKRLKNCSEIKESVYKDFSTMQMINEKLSKLDKTAQTIIKDLDVNHTSNVFEMNDKFKLILLCNKTILNLSNEENVYATNFLTNKKISQKAQKFFEDLHKKAYIKIMLP